MYVVNERNNDIFTIYLTYVILYVYRSSDL